VSPSRLVLDYSMDYRYRTLVAHQIGRYRSEADIKPNL
jgi:hypothetical protein